MSGRTQSLLLSLLPRSGYRFVRMRNVLNKCLQKLWRGLSISSWNGTDEGSPFGQGNGQCQYLNIYNINSSSDGANVIVMASSFTTFTRSNEACMQRRDLCIRICMFKYIQSRGFCMPLECAMASICTYCLSEWVSGSLPVSFFSLMRICACILCIWL